MHLVPDAWFSSVRFVRHLSVQLIELSDLQTDTARKTTDGATKNRHTSRDKQRTNGEATVVRSIMLGTCMFVCVQAIPFKMT